MYTVYKHTAPNGKVYIGITSRQVEKRWQNGHGYRHSPHFMNAINKYGWENIKHEILIEGLTKEEAEAKEIELIAFYKSTDRQYGYNADHGGHANRKLSEETKEKIRQAHIGMKYDDDFKKKISEFMKEKQLRLGQHQSEECKRKISEKNKGKFAGEKNYFHTHSYKSGDHWKAKAVERYDKEGNFIDCRPCAMDYARELGITNGAHINEVCKGKRKTAHGYIWKFAEVK